jgi:hypothetical protein
VERAVDVGVAQHLLALGEAEVVAFLIHGAFPLLFVIPETVKRLSGNPQSLAVQNSFGRDYGFRVPRFARPK